jgi:hypothetical protein
LPERPQLKRDYHAGAGTALGSREPDDQKFLPDHPQWFGWLCILGGPVLFIVLGQYAELPATRYPEQMG